MLCQNCGKHEATTHIKSVVNGEYTQLHLCSTCAGKLGYGDVFSGFGFDLGDFFGNFYCLYSINIGVIFAIIAKTFSKSFFYIFL